VRLSRETCAVTVRGNWDDFLPIDDTNRPAEMQWWNAELSRFDKSWLKSLPLAHHFTMSGRVVRLVHASAESVYTRIHPDCTQQEFDGMFADTEMTGPSGGSSVVCYGDIHNAFQQIRAGRTLINVGSVGNSLDIPGASYALLEGVLDGTGDDAFAVQFVRVPYDIEAEIRVAEELDMPALPQYAVELRTALYRGGERAVPLIEAERARLAR